MLGCQGQKRVAADVKETRQLANAVLAEDGGQRARADQAVLQRVAHAGGRLRAVRDHPPAAVGRARQIRRVGVQVYSVRAE